MTWLGWQALLLIPLLVAILGLVRLLRRRGGDGRPRPPIGRAFLASVLAHLGLLFGLDLILVTVPVVEAHREFLAETILKTFSAEPPARGTPPAWERLPDGPPVAEPLPDPAPAPASERAFAPELKDMTPTIPDALAARLPPSRLLFIPRPSTPVVGSPALDLPRAVAVRPDLPPLEAPALSASPVAPERAPEAPTVAVERRADELPARVPPLAAAPPRLLDPAPARAAPAPEPTARVALNLNVNRPARIAPSDDLEAPLVPPRPSREETASAPDLAPPRATFKEPTKDDRPLHLETGPRTVARRTEPSRMELKPTPRLPSLPPPRPAIVAAPVVEEREPTIQFAIRQPETRKEVVPALGGSTASEAAVERGLAWLAAHQGADGNWGLHDLHCKGHQCDAAGSAHQDAAATGLALMAFLGAGHAPNQGAHAESVRRGIAWLVRRQKPDGELAAPEGASMYGHALATIALCEALGLSGDPALREPAERALRFIIEAQDVKSGGWRYKPREGGDTSVVGWQVMALKSGEMAGLSVPAEVYDRVRHWLDSVGTGPGRLLSGYQPGREPTPAMTAEALLCRQYLGLSRQAESMVAGRAYLKANPPDWKSRNSYYWYYGTQVMFHLQGEPWIAWNTRLRDPLVDAQIKDGSAAGSWHPQKPTSDHWGAEGGRLYETALALLMLEVYYRHLPLYQQLGGTSTPGASQP